MESLDLNNLASSLPTSNLANAEKDLTNNFKAAALSLTTLYRSSRRTSKRAYNAGYAAACQDLLLMIQQGVSTGESSDTVGRGMTIGRIMDYIEARLEAIKSREEEEDEDEDKERERSKPGPSTSSADTKTTALKVPSSSASAYIPVKAKEQPTVAPSLPSSFPHAQACSMPSSPPSSSPPPTIVRTTSVQAPQTSRPSKSRLFAPSNAKDSALFAATATSPFAVNPPSTAVFPHSRSTYDTPVTLFPNPAPSASDMDAAVGSKRRHTVMMLDSSSAMPEPAAGTSRRRTRSSRALGPALAPHSVQDQNHTQAPEAMDVEEEGRERKRVARR
ncbi:hypothetical protein B0H21DRAFT_149534 [Amylocystis lapponica]|nr:hypothetical protein B0H21DRAFT_149534 [Amylocystis lapponica]